MPFELKARIGLDNSGLIAGLEQGKSAVRSFGSAMKSHVGGELAGLKSQFVAAFSAGALIGGIRGVAEFADNVDSVATKLEVSREEAQRLMYVAERTGSSVTQVLRAMGKEVKEYLLSAQQVREIMSQFDASGLSISDREIEKLAKLKSVMDDLAGYWKQTIGSWSVDFADAFGGTLANIGLLVEGLAESYLDRVNNKGEAQFEYGASLLAQAQLQGDEDYFEGLEEKRRLQQKFDDKMREKNRGRTGYSEPIGPPVAADILHDAKPVEELKKALSASFNRQFDSLARIGGFGANNDQQMTGVVTEILNEVRTLRKAVSTGGFGAEVFPQSL